MKEATKAKACAKDPASASNGFVEAFLPFPKTLDGLFDQRLVHCRYEPTAAGLAARGSIENAGIDTLIEKGIVRREGQRYEDFLPFSAAGIFASNLKQYGTECTATHKPKYTQTTLEDVLKQRIVDPIMTCLEVEKNSLQETYDRLGLVERPAKFQKIVDSTLIGA